MSKLDDTKAILKALGMPKKQQNENACYTLLAFATNTEHIVKYFPPKQDKSETVCLFTFIERFN